MSALSDMSDVIVTNDPTSPPADDQIFQRFVLDEDDVLEMRKYIDSVIKLPVTASDYQRETGISDTTLNSEDVQAIVKTYKLIHGHVMKLRDNILRGTIELAQFLQIAARQSMLCNDLIKYVLVQHEQLPDEAKRPVDALIVNQRGTADDLGKKAHDVIDRLDTWWDEEWNLGFKVSYLLQSKPEVEGWERTIAVSRTFVESRETQSGIVGRIIGFFAYLSGDLSDIKARLEVRPNNEVVSTIDVDIVQSAWKGIGDKVNRLLPMLESMTVTH